jgi:uncharacterized damage-inducible protein DinB
MSAELNGYLERLDFLRMQACEIIRELPEAGLNWQPLAENPQPPFNSLAALAAHLAGAEHYWLGEIFGSLPPTRDREAELSAHVSDSSALIHLLEKTGEETHAVFAGFSPANLDENRRVNNHDVSLRWAILQVIEHSALHLGHMQITYQLYTGGLGKPSPLWFERLTSQKAP